MLDISDTEIVRRWLAAAFVTTAKSNLYPADLARHCKVTPQAVNGWIKTGRITKKNLALATKFFGHGPSFTASATGVVEKPSPYGWPFKLVDLAEVETLSSTHLQRLDRLIRDRIDEWQEDAQLNRPAKKRSA